MSEPFLAEIRIVAFNFAPRGWALCDGQVLPINQNQSLYSLLGTTFGGDGVTSFALPDLRGRTAIHFDASFPLGNKAGEQTHALSVAELPSHQHPMQVSADDATTALSPGGNVLARSLVASYADATGSVTNLVDPGLLPASIKNAGGGQGHENHMPYLALNFAIAITGLFPSRN